MTVSLPAPPSPPASPLPPSLHDNDDVAEGDTLLEIVDITETPQIAKLVEHLPLHKGFISVEGFVFPRTAIPHLRRIQNFEVYEDDIWICSFPKSGTTWLQEITWCLQNNLDLETARTVESDTRVPFLEFSAIAPPVLIKKNMEGDSISVVEAAPRPRIIKSHLPVALLPRKLGQVQPRLIHITRNPRDVCVSYYYHMQIAEGYTGPFERWAELFLEGCVPYYTPFVPHLVGFQELSYDPGRLLRLKYENLKRDIMGELKRIAVFLGKSYNEDQLEGLVEHQRFANFQSNPMVNKRDKIKFIQGLQGNTFTGTFIRKGIVGDWKNHLSQEQVYEFEMLEQKIVKEAKVGMKLE